jgi:predicted dehydrogenase
LMKAKKRKPVSVVLVGIGGMGQSYLETILGEFTDEGVIISGVVEPYPEKSIYRRKLEQKQIPVYPALADFYQKVGAVDLAVICSPIQHHVPQTCCALEQGSCVLCEKPIGATVQEAELLIRSEEAAGSWVMIGYQWSFSTAIQDLKKDVMAGKFGRPLRLKTLCFWPRDEAYYKRNDWAGRIKDKERRWVLDSPANNAMAHFLHNLFYILGKRTDHSTMPVEVTAETYRAYPIENYDTIACRVFTREGVELLYYASHAVSEAKGPIFSFEFEEAVVRLDDMTEGIIARDKKGKTRQYGSPEAEHRLRKLFRAVEAVREPIPILCGPEAAAAQTLCVDGIQDSVFEIRTFPDSMIHRDDRQKGRWVEGLDRELYESYLQDALPGEKKIPWASRGEKIDLANYRYYPGGLPPEEKRE